MVEVTFVQLQGWIAGFFWPFVRITAFLAASPLWGHSSVPNQVKVAIGALVAMAVAPLVTVPDVPLFSWAALGVMIEQIMIGVAIGLVMQVTMAAIQAAGEFIGLQMGLAFATFFDPGSGTNMAVLSRYLYTLALLFFLAINGHLIVLEILATSFDTLPIGMGAVNASTFHMMARYGSTIFVSGMMLALPLMGSLLIISMALGILNRSAPQLTVFNIGFPLSLTVGITLMMVLMTDYGRFLQSHFSRALMFMREMLDSLAPIPLAG